MKWRRVVGYPFKRAKGPAGPVRQNGTAVQKFLEFRAECLVSPLRSVRGGHPLNSRSHWGADMRVQFLIAAAAITGGALCAAPAFVMTGPITVLAGCGHGYYQNSDGQCIPSPTAGGTPGVAGGAGDSPILVGGAGGNPPGFVGSPGGNPPGIGGPTGTPPGATAVCRDGDYSFSTHHTGTCSGHGGVRQWLGN